MADLVLYTNSFPYYSSEPFLETEIQYLSKKFSTVYIQPMTGEGIIRAVPVNFRILPPPGLKSCSKFKMYSYGIINSYLFLSEKTIRKNLRSGSLLKAIKYIGLGIWTKKKLEKTLAISGAIHYSYWLNYWAVALALLSREKKISYFVSRAHRYDLYTGKGEAALDFLKSFTIKYLGKLFLISEDGIRFISGLYPDYTKKYQLSKLGTSDPGFMAPHNIEGQLILVSCSALKITKRVGLILEALICLNQMHPEIPVTWFHLGDGEAYSVLEKKILEKLVNTQIHCNLKGNVANNEVIEFYRNQAVDVFINVSDTEGIPVSIMEAQSCSIPVLATSAGGTPEIVNNENGALVDVNILPEELAIVIYRLYLNREDWKRKRILSRQNWELKFCAEKNYSSFADELMRLL